jgi:hypothetical protein
MAPRAVFDWEKIESAYRAGMQSLEAIAREHGCSSTAIRKKAKELGWQRDLTSKVRVAVRAKLGSGIGSGSGAGSGNPELTEAAIIEAESDKGVGLVNGHRNLLARAQKQIGVMLAELEYASTHQRENEDAIDEETKGDANGLRRSRMLQSVSLPSRAGVIVNLSNAMTKLITLERQAFNLNDADDPDKPAGGTFKIEFVRARRGEDGIGDGPAA